MIGQQTTNSEKKAGSAAKDSGKNEIFPWKSGKTPGKLKKTGLSIPIPILPDF